MHWGVLRDRAVADPSVVSWPKSASQQQTDDELNAKNDLIPTALDQTQKTEAGTATRLRYLLSASLERTQEGYEILLLLWGQFEFVN